MKTTTFTGTSVSGAFARRVIMAATLAGAVLVGVLANAPSAWAQPTAGAHHSGPDYASVTGARVGAPSEQQVSTYGGSHKHLWIEQQLYGPGVVSVPKVDTTVHQSR